MNSLRSWNVGAAALHMGFAIWALVRLQNKDVTMYKLSYETSVSPASDLDYAMTTKEDGVKNVKSFVVLFFVLTSLAHILYATDFFGKGIYQKAVFGYGWNPFRWIEYSFTAGIMIYLIAIVAGAKESSNALVAALLVPGLMLQGLTVERELHQNELAMWASRKTEIKPATDSVLVWANFIPAWIFFAIKWYIIWNAYFELKKQLESEGKIIDKRITELVLVQFVGFATFGIVQSIQVYSWIYSGRGHWTQSYYINYEKGYIALSFIVKAALGISVSRLLA